MPSASASADSAAILDLVMSCMELRQVPTLANELRYEQDQGIWSKGGQQWSLIS